MSRGLHRSLRLRIVNFMQITRPLCWEQSLHALFSRPDGAPFPRTVEVGPGRQLGATLRMVNTKAFARYESVEV